MGQDPERQQVLVLLENWVRVCHEITQAPAQSPDKCRAFLAHLYAQVGVAGFFFAAHPLPLGSYEHEPALTYAVLIACCAHCVHAPLSLALCAHVTPLLRVSWSFHPRPVIACLAPTHPLLLPSP